MQLSLLVQFDSVFSIEFGAGIAFLFSAVTLLKVHGRLVGLSPRGSHVWKDDICKSSHRAQTNVIVWSFSGPASQRRFPKKLKKGTLQKQSFTQSFAPKVFLLFAFER